MCMLNNLMRKVSPDTSWHQRVEGLFNEFSAVSEEVLGFRLIWRNDVFWNWGLAPLGRSVMPEDLRSITRVRVVWDHLREMVEASQTLLAGDLE